MVWTSHPRLPFPKAHLKSTKQNKKRETEIKRKANHCNERRLRYPRIEKKCNRQQELLAGIEDLVDWRSKEADGGRRVADRSCRHPS